MGRDMEVVARWDTIPIGLLPRCGLPRAEKSMISSSKVLRAQRLFGQDVHHPPSTIPAARPGDLLHIDAMRGHDSGDALIFSTMSLKMQQQ